MDLSEIRKNIDMSDEQILQAFLTRMDLVDAVADYKAAHNLPILNRQRERDVLAQMTSQAGEHEQAVFQLFSTLFELARARQAQRIQSPTLVGQQVRTALEQEQALFPQTGLIACPGVEGGNSQAACDRLFPRGNLLYVKSFEAVFDAVESGLCKFGVLPIENSSGGSVRAVYDLLQRKRFSIVRSTRLCIQHELLALPGTTQEDIRVIYTHEQAISQCSQFLNQLQDVQVIPFSNTAAAAKQVAESRNPDAAAIASHSCASLYGLTCINDAIQNSDNNYTRFICISKESTVYAGANRISLILGCNNRPGALHSILAKLAALGINMTKLESCPVTGRNFEFLFFLDLEANLRQPGVLPMLEELERSCQVFHLLGNYSEV